eukprot:scaffold54873_cov67-Phaeocystis_antarctica.AAC.3
MPTLRSVQLCLCGEAVPIRTSWPAFESMHATASAQFDYEVGIVSLPRTGQAGLDTTETARG